MFDIKSPNVQLQFRENISTCIHSIRSVTIVYDRLSNSRYLITGVQTARLRVLSDRPNIRELANKRVRVACKYISHN